MPNFLARYIPANASIGVLQSRPGVRLRRIGNGRYEAVRMITAKDEGSVVREVLREKGVPLRIEKHRKTFLNTEVVTRGYKKSFLQALAFNAEAGMSPGKSLEMVIQSEANVAMQLELTAASDILAKGGTFSEAIDAIAFFDRVTIAILVAGEKTGSLRQAIASALDHYEASVMTGKSIFGMMGLIAFDLVTVVSTAVGVQYGFLPKMAADGIKSTDPKVIAAFHDKVALGYLMNGALLWIAGIVAVVAALFLYFSLSRNPGPLKGAVDRVMQKLPLLRKFFENTAVAASFSVAASMLRGGVRFSQTVAVATNSTNFPAMKHYWERVKVRMMLGDTVARAMYSPPIRENEFMLLSSHRSIDQLAKVVGDISRDRAEKAQGNAKVINRSLLAGAMIYSSISVLIYLWLLWIQNEAVLANLGAAK